MANRVAVTGMGAVTALGGDLPTVWRRLLAGDNGITRIRAFDASDYTCKVAAEAATRVAARMVATRSFPAARRP